MATHGGKRSNSGRKKSNPSKRITVPYELVGAVESMILEFKAKNQDNPTVENKPQNQVKYSATKTKPSPSSIFQASDVPRSIFDALTKKAKLRIRKRIKKGLCEIVDTIEESSYSWKTEG